MLVSEYWIWMKLKEAPNSVSEAVGGSAALSSSPPFFLCSKLQVRFFQNSFFFQACSNLTLISPCSFISLMKVISICCCCSVCNCPHPTLEATFGLDDLPLPTSVCPPRGAYSPHGRAATASIPPAARHTSAWSPPTTTAPSHSYT